MSPPDETIHFRCRELSGSRLRCLMYTSGSAAQRADRLTRLIALDGVQVTAANLVMPRGFLHKDEAKLGETPGFLSDDHREQVTNWWLKVRRGANTPNWDIVANATILDRPGLVLVEAKAHANELDKAGKPFKQGKTNGDNHAQIAAAIKEASLSLDTILPGWNLSRDSHYQLSNRFAWSWKIASLGVPVVLIYLGFLNADEMRCPLRNAREWADLVWQYSRGRIPEPETVWGSTRMVGETPFVPLIRTVNVVFESPTP
jgi:hypothetical protein